MRDAVEAGNRAFIAAFLRGDAAAVAQLYTETAQVIAPGEPVARGRAAIAAAWQKAIDAGVKDLSLDTAEVESAGDLASETGTVRLVAKDGGGHAGSLRGGVEARRRALEAASRHLELGALNATGRE